MINKLIVICIVPLFLIGCENNLFESFVTKKAKDKAQLSTDIDFASSEGDFRVIKDAAQALLDAGGLSNEETAELNLIKATAILGENSISSGGLMGDLIQSGVEDNIFKTIDSFLGTNIEDDDLKAAADAINIALEADSVSEDTHLMGVFINGLQISSTIEDVMTVTTEGVTKTNPEATYDDIITELYSENDGNLSEYITSLDTSLDSLSNIPTEISGELERMDTINTNMETLNTQKELPNGSIIVDATTYNVGTNNNDNREEQIEGALDAIMAGSL